jgi:hypothetical protein
MGEMLEDLWVGGKRMAARQGCEGLRKEWNRSQRALMNAKDHNPPDAKDHVCIENELKWKKARDVFFYKISGKHSIAPLHKTQHMVELAATSPKKWEDLDPEEEEVKHLSSVSPLIFHPLSPMRGAFIQKIALAKKVLERQETPPAI